MLETWVLMRNSPSSILLLSLRTLIGLISPMDLIRIPLFDCKVLIIRIFCERAVSIKLFNLLSIFLYQFVEGLDNYR